MLLFELPMSGSVEPSAISAEFGERTVAKDISAIADRAYAWVEGHVSWARHSWLAGLFLTAVALTIAWPNFGAFWRNPVWPERAMNWKIEHPLQAIPVQNYGEPAPDLEGTRAHLRKRNYRVTMC